jgi:hypothetical protein
MLLDKRIPVPKEATKISQFLGTGLPTDSTPESNKGLRVTLIRSRDIRINNHNRTKGDETQIIEQQ